MPRKAALPSDEELKLELRAKLIEMLRDPPKKEYRFSVPCKHSPAAGSGKELKHQVNVWVEDKKVMLDIIKELLDRTDGKAATKREPPKPKAVGLSLDELTDEQLEAIINGEANSETAEEAA